MRYDLKTIWDRITVEAVYKNLAEPTHGIITIIKERKKW